MNQKLVLLAFKGQKRWFYTRRTTVPSPFYLSVQGNQNSEPTVNEKNRWFFSFFVLFWQRFIFCYEHVLNFNKIIQYLLQKKKKEIVRLLKGENSGEPGRNISWTGWPLHWDQSFEYSLRVLIDGREPWEFSGREWHYQKGTAERSL